MIGLRIPLFFDIDGTLLDTGGAGRRAFIRALRRTLGDGIDPHLLQFAGATDLGLLFRVAQAAGLAAEGREESFFSALTEEMQTELPGCDGALLPGVRELLARLAGDDRFILGLITGNVQTCAYLKLARFGINAYFQVGAFGSEFADRGQIARQALARVRAGTAGADLHRPVVIGDTPHDIAAARAIGALAVAVATGAFAADALHAAGADHVLPNLADTEQVLRLLAAG